MLLRKGAKLSLEGWRKLLKEGSGEMSRMKGEKGSKQRKQHGQSYGKNLGPVGHKKRMDKKGLNRQGLMLLMKQTNKKDW